MEARILTSALIVMRLLPPALGAWGRVAAFAGSPRRGLWFLADRRGRRVPEAFLPEFTGARCPRGLDVVVDSIRPMPSTGPGCAIAHHG